MESMYKKPEMVGDGMKETLNFITEVVRFWGEHILWVNLVLAGAVVFFERRNPKSVWAWLLLLYFVPVVGFLFYLLIGVDLRKRKRFQVKEVSDSLQEANRIQEHSLQSSTLQELEQWLDKYRELIIYNLKAGGGVLTGDNDIDIFTDGNKLYDTIIEDLEKAKWFIHIQYYIIRDDILFERIREVLERKIKEGVEVRILYPLPKDHFLRSGLYFFTFHYYFFTKARLLPCFFILKCYNSHKRCYL